MPAPELLVLDEPVQGVDFTGEVALYEKIAEIRDRHGCAVLLVSHDLHVVMAASDRVICLNGHVCCAGVPQRGGGSAGISAAVRPARGRRGRRSTATTTTTRTTCTAKCCAPTIAAAGRLTRN